MKKIIFSLIALFLGYTLCAQKVDLTLQLEEGHTYHQRKQNNVTLSMEIFGFPVEMTMIYASELSYHVLHQDKNGYDMEMTLEDFSFVMETPQGEVIYGDIEEDNELKDFLSGIKGQKFKVKMTRKGALENISGLEDFRQAIMKMFPDTLESSYSGISEKLVTEQIENILKNSRYESGIVYPKKPVKKGDSWPVRLKMTSSGMPVEMKYKSKFEGEFDDHYLVTSEGGFEIPPSVHLDLKDMKLEVDMKGKSDSEFKLNKDTGWPAWGRHVTHAEGKLRLKNNEGGNEKFDIPVKIKIESYITDLK